jgi:hypothetical protein
LGSGLALSDSKKRGVGDLELRHLIRRFEVDNGGVTPPSIAQMIGLFAGVPAIWRNPRPHTMSQHATRNNPRFMSRGARATGTARAEGRV